jgi:pimeloyl-ACP methyl ester carboxylesterase
MWCLPRLTPDLGRAVRLMLPAAALSAFSATPPISSTIAELAGTWEGQMLLGSNWRYVEARFGAPDDPGGAQVDLPQERRQFRDFTVSGARLTWTLVRNTERIEFEGTHAGDIIRGRAVQSGVTGEFQLVRINRGAQRRESELAATYRTSQGDLITIARFDFGDGIDRLALMDTRDGYWGMLLPTDADRYVFAPARSGQFPTDLTLAFARSRTGVGRGLTMTSPSARVVASRIDAYDTRALPLTNGDITLAGEMVYPRTRGRHPAVVLVHSSGAQSRNGPIGYFRLIANLLATNGISAIVYDKRGVGKSTGTWWDATFDDLAGDLRAAIATARQQPNVDAGRVGIWGLSQAGWIAPLVASQDPDVAFLMLVGTAAVSPAQQEIERVATVMKANGAPDTDIELAGRYLRTFFDVVAGAQPWERLKSALADAAGASWLRYVPQPRSEREVGWSPSPSTLDPAPIFAKITVPVLTIHGASDVDVRATVNSQLYAKLSVHPGSRQRVFDNADHFILVGVDNSDRQYRRLAQGYLQTMIDWATRVAAADSVR